MNGLADRSTHFYYPLSGFIHYFCTDITAHSCMDLYGLIGRKLGHSLSAGIFNTRFLERQINARYKLFELSDISSLPALIDTHPDLKGFNVTVPYKESIIPFIDCMNPEARMAGAVNCVTVSRHPDGTHILTGHNTDIAGFNRLIAPFSPSGTDKALILGSGGAAKAVSISLSNFGSDVLIVSRHPSPLQMAYTDINGKILGRIRFIINATPLGMWPDTTETPPLPYHLLSPDHICLDLVYNPSTTEFMRRCADRGATVRSGLAMLHGQADENARIWGV